MDKTPPRLRLLEQLFTRQERLALAFLLAVGFGGFLVMGWQRIVPPAAPRFAQLTVRVNVATAKELAALPGIGPRLAKRIVEDRRHHGRYLTLTDLSRIKGITPKTLAILEGLLRFD